MGSRLLGSVVVAHRLSCSAARGIFPDRGSNPCPLHWQADLQPLHHQGSPKKDVFQLHDNSFLFLSVFPLFQQLPKPECNSVCKIRVPHSGPINIVDRRVICLQGTSPALQGVYCRIPASSHHMPVPPYPWAVTTRSGHIPKCTLTWMDKEDVVRIYNGVLLSHKKMK